MEKLKVILGLAFILMIPVFLVIYYLDESPSLEFCEQYLTQHGASKIVKIFDRFEKVSRSGRYSKLEYTYRSFEIEKNIDSNGEKIPHLLKGQIRCYPDFRTWNPFDSEKEEDFCNMQELSREPIDNHSTAVADPKVKSTKSEPSEKPVQDN